MEYLHQVSRTDFLRETHRLSLYFFYGDYGINSDAFCITNLKKIFLLPEGNGTASRKV